MHICFFPPNKSIRSRHCPELHDLSVWSFQIYLKHRNRFVGWWAIEYWLKNIGLLGDKDSMNIDVNTICIAKSIYWRIFNFALLINSRCKQNCFFVFLFFKKENWQENVINFFQDSSPGQKSEWWLSWLKGWKSKRG